MDQFPPAFPAWLAGLLGAWIVLGAGVYLSLARYLAPGRGKVSVREFGRADLVLCGGFAAWFITAIKTGFGAPDKEVTQGDILQGAALFLMITLLIGSYLYYRGINPFRQFGFGRLNPAACGGMAAGLLMCAFPLVMVAGKLTDLALNGKSRPQNIVQYFMNASADANRGAMYLTIAMAVVVAPVAEETIFRGYIYGVLKRYAGPAAAVLISAGLFAAMHLSLSALPALFLLALCLTLAYEATGSLLVNIFMHSLFNLSMLLVILHFSSRPGGLP